MSVSKFSHVQRKLLIHRQAIAFKQNLAIKLKFPKGGLFKAENYRKMRFSIQNCIKKAFRAKFRTTFLNLPSILLINKVSGI